MYRKFEIKTREHHFKSKYSNMFDEMLTAIYYLVVVSSAAKLIRVSTVSTTFKVKLARLLTMRQHNKLKEINSCCHFSSGNLEKGKTNKLIKI